MRHSTIKKLISLILAVSMFCSLFAITATAAMASATKAPDNFEVGTSTKSTGEKKIWVTKGYNDVGRDHWFYDGIQKWRKWGVVAGDENGNARLGDPITAAEIYTLLVRYAYADAFSGEKVNGAILGDYTYKGHEAWLDAYTEVNGKVASTIKDIGAKAELPDGKTTAVSRKQAFVLYAMAALSRTSNPKDCFNRFSSERLGYYAQNNTPITTYNAKKSCLTYSVKEDLAAMTPLEIQSANLLMYLGVLNGKPVEGQTNNSLCPDDILKRSEGIKLLACIDEIEKTTYAQKTPTSIRGGGSGGGGSIGGGGGGGGSRPVTPSPAPSDAPPTPTDNPSPSPSESPTPSESPSPSPSVEPTTSPTPAPSDDPEPSKDPEPVKYTATVTTVLPDNVPEGTIMGTVVIADGTNSGSELTAEAGKEVNITAEPMSEHYVTEDGYEYEVYVQSISVGKDVIYTHTNGNPKKVEVSFPLPKENVAIDVTYGMTLVAEPNYTVTVETAFPDWEFPDYDLGITATLTDGTNLGQELSVKPGTEVKLTIVSIKNRPVMPDGSEYEVFVESTLVNGTALTAEYVDGMVSLGEVSGDTSVVVTFASTKVQPAKPQAEPTPKAGDWVFTFSCEQDGEDILVLDMSTTDLVTYGQPVWHNDAYIRSAYVNIFDAFQASGYETQYGRHSISSVNGEDGAEAGITPDAVKEKQLTWSQEKQAWEWEPGDISVVLKSTQKKTYNWVVDGEKLYTESCIYCAGEHTADEKPVPEKTGYTGTWSAPSIETNADDKTYTFTAAYTVTPPMTAPTLKTGDLVYHFICNSNREDAISLDMSTTNLVSFGEPYMYGGTYVRDASIDIPEVYAASGYDTAHTEHAIYTINGELNAPATRNVRAKWAPDTQEWLCNPEEVTVMVQPTKSRIYNWVVNDSVVRTNTRPYCQPEEDYSDNAPMVPERVGYTGAWGDAVVSTDDAGNEVHTYTATYEITPPTQPPYFDDTLSCDFTCEQNPNEQHQMSVAHMTTPERDGYRFGEISWNGSAYVCSALVDIDAVYSALNHEETECGPHIITKVDGKDYATNKEREITYTWIPGTGWRCDEPDLRSISVTISATRTKTFNWMAGDEVAYTEVLPYCKSDIFVYEKEVPVKTGYSGTWDYTRADRITDENGNETVTYYAEYTLNQPGIEPILSEGDWVWTLVCEQSPEDTITVDLAATENPVNTMWSCASTPENGVYTGVLSINTDEVLRACRYSDTFGSHSIIKINGEDRYGGSSTVEKTFTWVPEEQKWICEPETTAATLHCDQTKTCIWEVWGATQYTENYPYCQDAPSANAKELPEKAGYTGVWSEPEDRFGTTVYTAIYTPIKPEVTPNLQNADWWVTFCCEPNSVDEIRRNLNNVPGVVSYSEPVMDGPYYVCTASVNVAELYAAVGYETTFGPHTISQVRNESEPSDGTEQLPETIMLDFFWQPEEQRWAKGRNGMETPSQVNVMVTLTPAKHRIYNWVADGEILYTAQSAWCQGEGDTKADQHDVPYKTGYDGTWNETVTTDEAGNEIHTFTATYTLHKPSAPSYINGTCTFECDENPANKVSSSIFSGAMSFSEPVIKNGTYACTATVDIAAAYASVDFEGNYGPHKIYAVNHDTDKLNSVEVVCTWNLEESRWENEPTDIQVTVKPGKYNIYKWVVDGEVLYTESQGVCSTKPPVVAYDKDVPTKAGYIGSWVQGSVVGPDVEGNRVETFIAEYTMAAPTKTPQQACYTGSTVIFYCEYENSVSPLRTRMAGTMSIVNYTEPVMQDGNYVCDATISLGSVYSETGIPDLYGKHEFITINDEPVTTDWRTKTLTWDPEKLRWVGANEEFVVMLEHLQT